VTAIPLTESGTVSLDASGNGTVTIGPSTSGTVWNISNLAVSTTSTGGTVPTGSGTPTYVIADNQDFANNTITPHDDLELAFDLEAGGVYVVEIFALFESTVNCDIRTDWGVPAGTTGLKQCLGATANSVGFTSRDQTQMRIGGHQHGTDVGYQLDTGGVDQLVWERGVVKPVLDGSFTFRWAQFAAVVGNLVRDSYSYLVWTKVA
jgi:hypothetical protein